MEFTKELLKIIGITAIAFVGYVLVESAHAFRFFDSNGEFLWLSALLVVALLVVGGILAYIGEKLWTRS